jgi:hypothetical protein
MEKIALTEIDGFKPSTSGAWWNLVQSLASHFKLIASKSWMMVALLAFGLDFPARGAFQFSVADSGVSSTLNAVAYDGVSSFVAVGTNSTVATATLSGNELLWVSNSVPTNNLNLKAVAFGGGIFVAGGTANYLFASTNGLSWSYTNKLSSGDANFDVQGLAFNAGNFSGGDFAAVTASIDVFAAHTFYTVSIVNFGFVTNSYLEWGQSSITNPAFVESFRAVTPFGANGFALCGLNGDVRISTDAGNSWNTNRNYNVEAYNLNLLGIASSSNMLVCVGTGGTIWVSANAGTNWFTANSGTTSNFNAVAYTAPGFIAVGDGGLIVTSLDGTNWTANASPTTANLYGVVYATSGQLKGVAVLVGDGGTVVIGSIPHTLGITNVNNNTAIVSWPSLAVVFTLQTNGDLATTNWGNYGGTIGDDGTNKTVTNSPSTDSLFFRLQ